MHLHSSSAQNCLAELTYPVNIISFFFFTLNKGIFRVYAQPIRDYMSSQKPDCVPRSTSIPTGRANANTAILRSELQLLKISN